jgi:hypothetical protein
MVATFAFKSGTNFLPYLLLLLALSGRLLSLLFGAPVENRV